MADRLVNAGDLLTESDVVVSRPRLSSLDI